MSHMAPIQQMAGSSVSTTDQLNSALAAVKAIKILRSNAGQVFETLGSGIRADHGEEGRDTKFVLELQEQLTTVSQNLREMETIANILQPQITPLSLGNTSFLSQETIQERQALYPQIVSSFKWIDKIHEYSQLATTILSANGLKRTNYLNNSNKRRRPLISYHNVSAQSVDNVLTNIHRSFGDLQMKIGRPFASNAIVHLTVGRVLRASLVFKGIMIEWITIKGFDEHLEETEDVWTESRHKVFRKIQDHTHSAMLHFHSPMMPDLAVRSFMAWIMSYTKLFNEPCKKCGNRLLNASPPTWRDFRTAEPFHEECK